MEEPAKKKKRSNGERIDWLDWLLLFSDILMFLPRLFGRFVRWLIDLF